MSQPSAAPPPIAVLFQMITGKWVSAAIGMACRFRIADHLADGSKTAAELAALSGTQDPELYRLLRALASVGIFTEQPGHRFAQNDMSDLLREGKGPRNLAMFFLDEWHMRGWAAIPDTIRTGKTAADIAFGMSGFEFLQKNPGVAANFNAAMTDMSRQHAPAVAAAYDFSGFKHIADVGGGMGMLLSAILQKTPGLRGTVCELPYVIDQARTGPLLAPFKDRCDFFAGSFLESLPAGPDAYIMKHILHDWNDADSQRILTNIRKVIPPAGKLLVVDYVIAPPNQPDMGKLMDLEMLLIGGRERTEQEWAELYQAGGFKLTRIVPTQVGLPIIEGIPV